MGYLIHHDEKNTGVIPPLATYEEYKAAKKNCIAWHPTIEDARKDLLLIRDSRLREWGIGTNLLYITDEYTHQVCGTA